MKLLKAFPFINVYEGDGTGDGTGTGTAAATTTTTPEKKPEGKFYTQDDINKMMADNKRGLQTNVQKLTGELEEMKKNVNLTVEEKEKLQTRIDELNSQFTTKEEQLRREAEKKQKEYSGALETTSKDRDSWKERFTGESTKNQIILASNEHKAVSAKQIQDILMPKTRLAEELGEDGKPTGNWMPRVKLSAMKDGKPIELDLTIGEAVKHMKDSPEEYGNLFDAGIKAGLGGSGNRTPSAGGPPKDHGAYLAWRKAQKSA